jgi:hypothetical protein
MGGKHAGTPEEQKTTLDSVEEALVGHEVSETDPDAEPKPDNEDRPPVPGHRSP